MCSQTVSWWIGRLPKTNQDIDKELQGEQLFVDVMTYITMCFYYQVKLCTYTPVFLCISQFDQRGSYTKFSDF